MREFILPLTHATLHPTHPLRGEEIRQGNTASSRPCSRAGSGTRARMRDGGRRWRKRASLWRQRYRPTSRCMVRRRCHEFWPRPGSNGPAHSQSDKSSAWSMLLALQTINCKINHIRQRPNGEELQVMRHAGRAVCMPEDDILIGARPRGPSIRPRRTRNSRDEGMRGK